MTNPRLEELARRQRNSEKPRETSLKQRKVVVNDKIMFLEEYKFLEELRGMEGAKSLDIKIKEGKITELDFSMLYDPLHIPESIQNLTALKSLSLSGDISEIPKGLCQLKQLKKLGLYSHNASFILPKEFGNLTNLELLYLSRSHLGSLPKSIRNLKKVRVLHLFENRFEVIPEEIGGMSKIEYLDIKKNQIKYLPTSICQLKYLRMLSISNNPLAQLPKGIEKLQSLASLNIRDTLIEELPEELVGMPNLELIFTNEGAKFPKELAGKVYYPSDGSVYRPNGWGFGKK